MDQGEIPEAVLRFVLAQIDTVPHLEALLLLWEASPREWTDHEIAARVYVSVDVARQILQDLTRRHLARSVAGSAGAYAYDGSWDPSGDRMREVAGTYRRRLVQVASLIHSKGSAAVREFARAFQLKNE